MSIIKWWKYCRKQGHVFVFDGQTLGGDWIVCVHCNKLDEFLPGVHEPRGYRNE